MMKKFLSAILVVSFVLCNLSFISFAAPQSYTVNGEKTVFLSNTETVTYGDNTYFAYSSLANAISALGTDGGKAIVCGSFVPDDNSTDVSFVDPNHGTVTITGAVGADTDSIKQNGTLNFKGGKVIFDDVTLKMGSTRYLAAPNIVFTERFKVDYSGGNLYFTGLNNGPAASVNVEISGGTFAQINMAGINSATLGNATTPGYGIMTINGGKINPVLNFGSGYSVVTVNGNLFFVINGGEYVNKTFAANKITHASGRKFAIFNNGMDAGFNLSLDGLTVVKSVSGGNVSVDKESASSVAPKLLLTPEEDLVPFVNGNEIYPVGDKYFYTLSESGTFNVTWSKSTSGGKQAYIVNGQKTVFLSNEKTVLYNDSVFYTYDSLSEALSELGTDGGNAIISGQFVPSDNVTGKSFVDPVRGTVTITGAVGADTDALVQGGALDFKNGKVIFDDITVKMSSTQYLSAHDAEFTENFKVDLTNGKFYFTGALGGSVNYVNVKISGGTFAQINMAGMNGATLGSAAAPGYGMITVNGGNINPLMNFGSGYANLNAYGNLFFVINGGQFVNKGFYENKLTHNSGRKFVILNNGMTGFSISPENVTVIRSASGGRVEIDTSTATLENPVINLIPDGANIPVVDGSALSKNGDKYSFTLSETKEYNVTWQIVDPEVYVINGIRTAFLSDDSGEINYKDNKYYPFTSITDAVTALGVGGGKILVSGKYTHKSFVDTQGRELLEISGTDYSAVIEINEESPSDFTFNGGKTKFDDIYVSVTSSGGKYLHGGSDTIFTENFRSDDKLFVSNIYSKNVPFTNLYINSGSFATIDVAGSNAQIGSENVSGHASVYFNGGSVKRLNGGWGWAAKPLYGNMFIYINGGEVTNGVINNTKSAVSGTKNVIFNNGSYIKSDKSEIPVADGFDYVIMSEKGGTVAVEDEDTINAPVFVLTPETGKVPFVNGARVPFANGKYSYTPSQNGKFYVTWQNTVTVSFDSNGGSGNAPKAITVLATELTELPIYPSIEKENHIFSGWNTDKNATVGYFSSSFETDTVLYAIWTEKAPVLAHNPNFEANGVVSVETSFVSIDKESVKSALASAMSDPVFINTATVQYGFEINAYDAQGNIVDFSNGIDFVIPDYAYTHENDAGEFLRLYYVSGSEALLVSDIEKNTEGYFFTAERSGEYFVMLNTPDSAEYICTVQETVSGIKVDVYINGVNAQGGFFGVKYPDDLSLTDFSYASGITSVGYSEELGGYGCFVNENNIYCDAWMAENYLDATEEKKLVATFNFDERTDESFEPALMYEYADKVPGYPKDAPCAYLPYIECDKCFYQPASYIFEKEYPVYIGEKGYESLTKAIEEANVENTVITVTGIALITEDTDASAYTLDFGENALIVLENGAKLVYKESIYSKIFAETSVGVHIEDGYFTYQASSYEKDNIKLDGVQIRTEGEQGLRFIAELEGSAENTYKNYGIIVIPTHLSDGANTTHQTYSIGEISKIELGDNFKYFEIGETSFKYTVCITKILVENYARDFTARPYFTYTDENGDEYTVYAEYDESFNLSTVDVAQGLIDSGDENSEYYQTIIDRYNSTLK